VPDIAAGGTDPSLQFGPVMGMRVLGLTIRMMAGGSAEEIKVDAVHGFRPVGWIAALECQKTCNTATQEFPWDER
jgi:hypothetical protein